MGDNAVAFQLLFTLLMAWGGFWVKGIARDVDELKRWMNEQKGAQRERERDRERDRDRAWSKTHDEGGEW